MLDDIRHVRWPIHHARFDKNKLEQMETHHSHAFDLDRAVRHRVSTHDRLDRARQLVVQHCQGSPTAVRSLAHFAFHAQQTHHGHVPQQFRLSTRLLSHHVLCARNQHLFSF